MEETNRQVGGASAIAKASLCARARENFERALGEWIDMQFFNVC